MIPRHTATHYLLILQSPNHQSPSVPFRCCDDRAIFEFENNGTLHYWFADQERNKSVEDALESFDKPATHYDAIVANAGNEPVMDTEHVVSAAEFFHQAGVPFLWLTTYDGVGDIRSWDAEDRQAFEAANGKHIPVHEMMESMGIFTRGVVETMNDDHFCLPGPPDELGLLILQVIWALDRQRTQG